MLSKIIVPLDGSKSAQSALAIALQLAKLLNCEIILLHLLEVNAPHTRDGEDHLRTNVEAEEYLNKIKVELNQLQESEEKKVNITCHVHNEKIRRIAKSIISHAEEFGESLVVIAVHKKHGFANTLSGSIPLKIASWGESSVLMVSNKNNLGKNFVKKIILPLDGNTEHEAAIPMAIKLAKNLGLEIKIITVVPIFPSQEGGNKATLTFLHPSANKISLEYTFSESKKYLERLAEKIRQSNIKVSTKVLRGKSSLEIINEAEKDDLVVVSTHRRLGLDASLEDSVSSGIARKWKGSMLMVPILSKSKIRPFLESSSS